MPRCHVFSHSLWKSVTWRRLDFNSFSFFCCRCSCGNCNRVLLQNLSECYCCNELEGCKEAMSSELVLQDLPEGTTTIKCITDHPGFKPVCLEKWSLRMAAEKFRTKTKQRYQQTGTEERWGWRTFVFRPQIIVCTTLLHVKDYG